MKILEENCEVISDMKNKNNACDEMYITEFLSSIDGSSDIATLNDNDSLLRDSCGIILNDLFTGSCSGVNILRLDNSALVASLFDKPRVSLDNSGSIKLNSSWLPIIFYLLKKMNLKNSSMVAILTSCKVTLNLLE